MINYLGKFSQNLSTRNQPLRQLLETDVLWNWQKAFTDLKRAVTSTPTLKYFSEVNEEVKLSVDALSYGLGACLVQKHQPVAYASRALKAAERNFAQIEK